MIALLETGRANPTPLLLEIISQDQLVRGTPELPLVDIGLEPRDFLRAAAHWDQFGPDARERIPSVPTLLEGILRLERRSSRDNADRRTAGGSQEFRKVSLAGFRVFHPKQVQER